MVIENPVVSDTANWFFFWTGVASAALAVIVSAFGRDDPHSYSDTGFERVLSLLQRLSIWSPAVVGPLSLLGGTVLAGTGAGGRLGWLSILSGGVCLFVFTAALLVYKIRDLKPYLSDVVNLQYRRAGRSGDESRPGPSADAIAQAVHRMLTERETPRPRTVRPGAGAVVHSLVERTARDALEAASEHGISVLVHYPDDVDQQASVELVQAVGQVAGAFDLEIAERVGPVRGSLSLWFRARRRQITDAAGTDLGKELGADVKRAVQLRAVDAEQAKVDDAKAAAVQKLINATEHAPVAVVQVGALLLVKVNGVLAVRDLTPAELTVLRRNPSLINDPATLLAKLEASAEIAMVPSSLPAELPAARPDPGDEPAPG
ncbi:hypothetical protein [Nonomuraea sp. SBT364]|uniref:hypothetical protein n=1 Tax=Nonomuraea sp. SBT364 TaxID=1580530 RepID=UPI00066B04EE|nr:hypothetical protein [Nonomuraea sp. SBT364]